MYKRALSIESIYRHFMTAEICKNIVRFDFASYFAVQTNALAVSVYPKRLREDNNSTTQCSGGQPAR